MFTFLMIKLLRASLDNFTKKVEYISKKIKNIESLFFRQSKDRKRDFKSSTSCFKVTG